MPYWSEEARVIQDGGAEGIVALAIEPAMAQRIACALNVLANVEAELEFSPTEQAIWLEGIGPADIADRSANLDWLEEEPE